jgi:hypothetical protein
MGDPVCAISKSHLRITRIGERAFDLSDVLPLAATDG